MMPSFASRTKTGSGGKVWEEGCKSRNANLVLRPSRLLSQLQLVSYPDPLTHEPNISCHMSACQLH